MSIFLYILQYPSISYNVVACHHTNTVQYPDQAAVTCALVMCIYISLSMCMIQIDPIANLKLFISEGLLILYQSHSKPWNSDCLLLLGGPLCCDVSGSTQLFSMERRCCEAARSSNIMAKNEDSHFHAFPCISTLSIVSLCVSITVRKVSCLQCLQCWLTLPCPRLSDTICRIQTIPSSDNRQLQLSFSVGAEHQ